MMGPRRAVRRLLLELGYLARVARRDRSVVVLLYHRVLPSPSPEDTWSVSVSDFAEQMRTLWIDGFRDVPLAELEASRARPRGKAVLVAFDDGYRSAVDHALPVLQAMRRTAAFFLVPGAMGAASEWERPFGLRPSPIMDWAAARRLLAAGMSIGSHSLTHRDLRTADEGTLHDEIVRSKEMLERELGTAVRSFSMPFGGDDGRADGPLAAAGYRCKLTDPFSARRHGPLPAYAVSGISQGDSIRDLRLHLSGAHDVLYAYHRIRRGVRAMTGR